MQEIRGDLVRVEALPVEQARSEALAFENLIGNRWGASRPAEILASDMTASYAKGTYYELTLYFDTFDREIVRFGLTDRGAVYSSRAFNELLSNHSVVHSMSRAGTPTDNPIDESLNGWIKDELFIDFDLRKCDNVLSLIKAYVDYYNNERPICCLGYKTPRQYRTDMGY